MVDLDRLDTSEKLVIYHAVKSQRHLSDEHYEVYEKVDEWLHEP